MQFSEIAGGRAAFDHACAELSIAAALAQAQFSATLDRIGPPGQARWDPIAGEIELRGRTFEAQQLGSFDGASWLWSWANPYLAIPDAKLTMARGLAERAGELGIAALAVPGIAARDETIPYAFGAIAIAHGACEAYYLANQSQVYMIAPGQLDRVKDPPIARLRAAIDGAIVAGVATDLSRAVPFAARALKLACEREERRLVVREGRDELVVHLTPDGHGLQPVALCFVAKQVTIDDVFAHFRKKRGVAEMPLERVGDAIEIAGQGYAIRVTRTDRLRDVMREANRAGLEEAKRYGAVLVVEAVHTPEYPGVPCAIYGGGFMRGWAPAGGLEGPNGEPPSGPKVTVDALYICERLNELDGALVYDLLMKQPYPRQ